MFKRPEYRHFFCQPCADSKKQTVFDSPMMGIEIRWQSLASTNLKCGQWSADGKLKIGNGCGNQATIELLGLGGNPIQYMTVDASPVLQGQPARVYEDTL